MLKHGNLGKNGFGDQDEIPTQEVNLCKKWIESWITPKKSISKEYGSYHLKHAVERNSNEYISNGAFIAAAIELNYKYIQDGPNAHFNMSFVNAKNNNEESSFNL